MENLRDIIKNHAADYPNMEIEDAVKLVYQHTFGWDEKVDSEEAEMAKLTKEYSKARECKEEFTVENIGNGYARVYLNGLPHGNLTVEKLGEVFLESCEGIDNGKAKENPKENLEEHLKENLKENLEENLEDLVALTREDYFQFEYRELQRFLWDYEEKGYPPLKHSPRYEGIYEPFYRVVKMSVLNREMTSFSKEFFKIYDKKLASGEITFHSLGIPKPLFVVICNNSSYVPTDELLEKLTVTMKLTKDEKATLYNAAGKGIEG